MNTPVNTAARLEQLAQQGRAHLRRTQEEILAFGEVLIEAKSLLPHGQIRAWCHEQFGVADSVITFAMKEAQARANVNAKQQPPHTLTATKSFVATVHKEVA